MRAMFLRRVLTLFPAMSLGFTSLVAVGATVQTNTVDDDSFACEASIYNFDGDLIGQSQMRDNITREFLEERHGERIYVIHAPTFGIMVRVDEGMVGSVVHPQFFVKETWREGSLIQAEQFLSCATRSILGLTGSVDIDCTIIPGGENTNWQPMLIRNGRSYFDPDQASLLSNSFHLFGYDGRHELTCRSTGLVP